VASQAAPTKGEGLTIWGDAAPCVGAAPCDAPGLPDGPTAVPDGKAVTTTLAGHLAPDAAGARLPSEPRCTLPARRADRVDEPPERAGAA
jgi:hypothetical protein